LTDTAVIVITTSADSFVRDTPLSWTDPQLLGDKVTGGVRVQIAYSH
jgi:hypothetical protein